VVDPLRVLLFAAYMAFLALAEGVVWFVPPGFTRPRFLGTGRRPLALPFENDGGSREEDLVPCQFTSNMAWIRHNRFTVKKNLTVFVRPGVTLFIIFQS